MSNPTFAEISDASRNALLSTKLFKLLRRASRSTAQLVERERQLLNRGADLLSSILQGSLLLEKRPLEVGIRADLDAYGHALAALTSSNLMPSEAKVPWSEIFRGYRDDLCRLSEDQHLEAPRLQELSEFFSLLSDSFFHELQRTASSGVFEPSLAIRAAA